MCPVVMLALALASPLAGLACGCCLCRGPPRTVAEPKTLAQTDAPEPTTAPITPERADIHVELRSCPIPALPTADETEPERRHRLGLILVVSNASLFNELMKALSLCELPDEFNVIVLVLMRSLFLPGKVFLKVEEIFT